MSKNQELISVDFEVYCETQFGQIAYICGNLDQFGSWMPIASLRLYTDHTLYPKWYSFSPIHIEKNSLLQFKICLLDSNGKLIKWESLSKNRIISLNKNCKVILTEGETNTEFDYEKRGFLAVLADLQSDSSSSLPYEENYWLNQKYREVMEQFQKQKNINFKNNNQMHDTLSSIDIYIDQQQEESQNQNQQIQIYTNQHQKNDPNFQGYHFSTQQDTMEQINFNCNQLKINIVTIDKKNKIANDLTPKIKKKGRIISNSSIKKT